MARLLAACAVLLTLVGWPLAFADTDVDTVSSTDGVAGSPETVTIKATSKKPPLICKWETPMGSRVAKQTCHRSSDADEARRETRAAADTVQEATTVYPRSG